MKALPIRITAMLLILLLLTGCAPATNGGGAEVNKTPNLNGIALSEFTIVYSESEPDYNQRAATYIQTEVKNRTGMELAVCTAASGNYAHEIVVGETDRAISAALEAETKNVEFSILADENHIALEGDYFIIAAAAYFFVETYIPGKSFDSVIPKEISIHAPITEKAKNFIFLIGDGMGINHTKMFDKLDIHEDIEFHDNEDIFYGYYLPYQGTIMTSSLSGTTDSAAGATALACGYKTYNSYVGKDKDLNDVQSLTELANSKKMATAILSTDLMTGATPAGFSAHADNRDNSDAILESQRTVKEEGTIVLCGLHSSGTFQNKITQTLETLGQSENGFFIMYEEGYIDKFSHKWNLEETFASVVRFNQAIGVFMEYAFYHPDTFLIITADHETGGLHVNSDGNLEFGYDGHTPADVPIFGYGQGAEVFAGYCQENNEVPKVIAALWGVADFGDQGAK